MKDKKMKDVLTVLGEQDPNEKLMFEEQLKRRTGLSDEEFKQQIRTLLFSGLIIRFIQECFSVSIDYYGLSLRGREAYIEERNR